MTTIFETDPRGTEDGLLAGEFEIKLPEKFDSIEEVSKALKENMRSVFGDYSSSLSCIEPHEEQEAKDFVEKNLGFPAPRASGFWMYVKIHYDQKDIHEAKNDDGSPKLDPEGNPIVFYLPETANPHEKYKSCTALVVSQGPDAYKGDRFKESGPWCKVGDWIVIPPNEGFYLVYRKIPMRIIPDDKCLGVVEDPSYVTRT